MKNDHTKFQANDFIGWGTEGLIEAAKKFDSSKGVQFNIFADRIIRGRILDGLRLHNSQNFMRRSHVEFLQARGVAIQSISGKFKRDPTEGEIAMEMNLTLKQYHKRLQEYPIHAGVVSTNNIPDDDGNIETGRFLDSLFQEVNPYGSEDNKEFTIELLKKFLAQLSLSKQEHQVIDMYFMEEMTLKKIGEKLGVTESRCSQIKNAVINKLRKLFEKEGYNTNHKNLG